jgi:hypothetical protein
MQIAAAGFAVSRCRRRLSAGACVVMRGSEPGAATAKRNLAVHQIPDSRF